MPRPFLTIGMSVCDDYDGFYFTIQAIRLYHPEILDRVEFLVIDNNPQGPSAKSMKALEYWAPGLRCIPYGSRRGTASRDLIFREAAGQFVLCIDSHVMFPPGALARLIAYCQSHPESRDLLQGPLLHDNLNISTHLEPRWWPGHLFYGEWAMDDRAHDVDAPPFEIAMQGLGAFACRRSVWPGFNPRFAGFGGEEGYIHEKFRRAGGRTLCLPFLRWMHRFARPAGVPFAVTWQDRLRNYLIAYEELGLDPAPVIRHLEQCLDKDVAAPLIRSVQAQLAGPFHFFDAVCCYRADGPQSNEPCLRAMGIDSVVRRFAGAESRILSHRAILQQAKKEQLRSLLVFSGDVPFSADATAQLKTTLAEIEGLHWRVLYLGEYGTSNFFRPAPGCNTLETAHAVAWHCSAFDEIA